MVRRAAAQKLGSFAKVVERDYVSRELMQLFTDLTQDGKIWLRPHRGLVFVELFNLLFVDQDSVRLLAVESCGAFASALSREDAGAHLLPVVHKFAQVGVVFLKMEHPHLLCVNMNCPVCVQDKSWRVRYNVANQLVQLCEALGQDITR